MIGLAERLAAVVTVAPSGADIARDPAGSRTLLVDACRSAVERHGADVVILGGAGLAGMAAPIGGAVRVPLVDSTQALMAACVAVHALRPAKPTAGVDAITPPVETTGLSAALATRFGAKV